MNLILAALLLQSLMLPQRIAIENPSVVSEVPRKLKKDYDKAWKRFVAGKEDSKLVKDLDNLLKKQKDLDAVFLLKGYVDLYHNDDTLAEQKFERALTFNPNNRIALYYLAELAFARNDYPRASIFYARLIAITRRTDVETKYQKALLLATEDLLRSAAQAERENRLADAEELYRQAVNVSPREPAFHARLAGLLAKDKKWEDALTHYRRQQELAGAGSEVEKNIAEALMNLGRTEEARDVLEHLRKEGSVDETLEAKVNELEDLGRWGNDIDLLKEIRAAESITREQLAALIVRYFPQVTEFRQSPQIVTDIQDSRARAEIQTMVGVGLIDPYPNHTFEPSTSITRAELASSLARLTRLLRVPPTNAPPIPLSDLAPGNRLYPDIQAVLGLGLMTLDERGNFSINGKVAGKDAVRAVERVLGFSRKKEA